MSVSKQWIDTIEKVGKQHVEFTNTIAIKWNHYGKEEWFTAVIDEMDENRGATDGKIHHALYVSDGKEEWIDLNSEDWRLLPKNWQDKEKKFLAAHGQKKKKVDKKKRKSEKRPRKSEPTSGKLAYDSSEPPKKKKKREETAFMPLTWETSLDEQKRVESSPKQTKANWPQSGGVDFSLPNTCVRGNNVNKDLDVLAKVDDRVWKTPNTFESFKGPRKSSISKSPRFSTPPILNSTHSTPTPQKKAKPKKKRKNKAEMPLIDCEYIQTLYPKNLYFRRYNVISSNGRRFSFGYLYLCPYGGFFTAWQKKSSRLVTLPKLSVVTRTSQGEFLVQGLDKHKATWVISFRFITRTQFVGELIRKSPPDSTKKPKPLQIEGSEVTYPNVNDEQTKILLQKPNVQKENEKRLEKMNKVRNKLEAKRKKLLKLLKN